MRPRVVVRLRPRRPWPERPRARRPRRRPAGPRRRGRPGRSARRAANSMPGPLVELGLRGVEEDVAVAEGDRAGDDREAQVEQVDDRRHGPADQPAGPLRAPPSGASAAGAPVRAAMAVPARLGLEAALRAAGARAPVGLDDDVADVAGVAVVAVEEPAVEDDAAADAGRHDHREVVALALARRRASPRRGRAPWRRCRRGRAGRARPTSRARSGKPAPAGDVERRHRLAARVIGPPHPTPQATSSPRAHLGDRVEQRREDRPRRRPSGVGRSARASSSPSAVDDAGRHLRAADVDREHTRPRRGNLPVAASTAAASRPAGHRPTLSRPRHVSRSTPLATRQTAVRDDLRRPPRRGRSTTSSGSSRASPRSSSSCCSAWSPRATCSSRTCPASARPAWPRRSPRRSTAPSAACSSPPTCSPPTSSASRSGTATTSEFEFRPGPVFGNIVLADEINRASPKTQSALLEAMAETQVTVDGTTYQLRQPVHGDRHPEPDRARGHLPAARVPARPVPHAHLGRLPVHREASSRSSTPTATTTRSTTSARVITDHDVQDMVDAAKAVHVAPASRRTSSTWPARRAATRTSRSACRRAPRSRSSGSRGRGRPPAAAATSCPTTSRRSPSRCSPTACSSRPEAQLQGITRGRRPHRGAAGGPRPGRQGEVGAACSPGRAGWSASAPSPCWRPAGSSGSPSCSPSASSRPRCSSAPALLVGTAARSSSRSAAPSTPPASTSAPPAASTSPSATCAPPPRRCCGCAIPVSGTRGADLLVPPLGRGRAHRRGLPAAHRPPRPRADRPARRRGGRPVRPHEPRHGRRAEGGAHRVPARRPDRPAARTPPATTRWPAPASPTRSAAPARTSTRCGPTSSATTCAASTGPPRRATTSSSSARTSCPGRAAPPCCSTCARPPTPATRSRSRCRRRPASWRPPPAGSDLVRLVTTAGTDSDFAPGSDHIEAIMEHLAIVPAAPDRQPAPRRSRCSAGTPPAARSW